MTSYKNELGEVEALKEAVANAKSSMAIPAANEPSNLSVTVDSLKIANDPNIFVTSGPQQTVTLPSSNWGNVTISGTTSGSLGYGTSVIGVDTSLPTDQMLWDLKEALEERARSTKKELDDLAHRYEDAETMLQGLQEKIKDLASCIKGLSPPETADEDDEYDDIPF
jgi:hypothetical protein